MSELDDPKEKEKVNESSLEQVSDIELQRSYSLLDERLRAIKGDDIYKVIDATEPSLVLDLVIPLKFKVPNFTKYGGTSYPTKHITMYYTKMVKHTRNDMLLTNYF